MEEAQKDEERKAKAEQIKADLKRLAEGTSCTEQDERLVQSLLRFIGMPRAVVTCGIVYPEGTGQPFSIHSIAKQLLTAVEA